MVGGAFQAANKSDFSDGVILATIDAAPADGVMTTLAVNPAYAQAPFTYVR